MNKRQTESNAGEPKIWQPTQYSNLVRYVPSGTYFARLRVSGKLIRQSLKTKSIPVAKMRLADVKKAEREVAESRTVGQSGRMTFGECAKLFSDQTDASDLIKPRTKLYRKESLNIIRKTWPEIENRDVRQPNGGFVVFYIFSQSTNQLTVFSQTGQTIQFNRIP